MSTLHQDSLVGIVNGSSAGARVRELRQSRGSVASRHRSCHATACLKERRGAGGQVRVTMALLVDLTNRLCIIFEDV